MGSHRKADAFFGQTSQGIARIEPKRTDVDLDEVRLDLLEVDRNAGSLQSLREPTRPGVVVRQTLDIVVERIDPGGGDDPGLPHRSTELVLETARLSHQVMRPGNEPDGSKWLDVPMLAVLSGKERTEAQWRELLAAGGFEPVQFHEALIEAVPAADG